MIKFGTGGWRAVIGDDFNKHNICKVAQGISDLMKENKKAELPVMIGYDNRFLSSDAARWMAEVFSANGIKSWCMKRSAPTPLVMFTVKDKKLHYGVEITASHNPAVYNGIKLIVEEGRDADIGCTKRLEELIGKAVVRSEDFSIAQKKGNVTYLKAPFNGFIDSILSRLDVEKIKQADLRVLFDPMHGSAAYPMMTVLFTARVTIDIMNSNKDAYFGGKDPAPGYKESENLRYRVKTEGYDLGIQVDSDGDRLAIIDNEGNYIEANKILVMLYYYLHEYKGWTGGVVRNVATTHMLDAVAASFNEKCYEVPVGFKFVSKALDENDAMLGGESSGGLTVRGHIFGKDSVYATGLFVEMLSVINKPVMEIWSELEEKFGVYKMVQYNSRFTEKESERVQKILFADKAVPDFKIKPSRISYMDGVKYYFNDDSFVICRFSGTEPLLRIFAEAKTEEQGLRLIQTVKEFIK